ncbi:MAG: XdhC family protein [Acidobacteria bacterium]|nr:XdhC family protein [Acidobacteriota bacterium]
MICSGRQTVIVIKLTPNDAPTIDTIIKAIDSRRQIFINISQLGLTAQPRTNADEHIFFEKTSDTQFDYSERLGYKNAIYIIGGGHCALALSELMSKLDFRITIFDDRQDLNTIEKNRFADEVRILESYNDIGDHIASDREAFVVVMTLGYAFDEIVIRNLIENEFRYFGVLGSKAKMAVLFKTLENEGFPAEKLSRIRTPIGLPINSHTPEEIAVSIAAEIIQVKNTKRADKSRQR